MKKTSILLAVLFFNLHAWGFGTHLNSSKVLKTGEYDISALGQLFSDDRRGAYIGAMADLPAFNSRTNWRFYAGTGSFDYAMGALLKWVPLQQLDQNKYFSSGLTFGADYGRDDTADFLVVRVTPFISREFSWEFGTFEPYFALPLGNIYVDASTKFYTQAAVGSHIKFEELEYMRFSIEGGFNIDNSESYLALLATIQLTQR